MSYTSQEKSKSAQECPIRFKIHRVKLCLFHHRERKKLTIGRYKFHVPSRITMTMTAFLATAAAAE